MKFNKKLPDAEFEVMQTIWKNQPPITTRILMDQIGLQKGWKMPALITLLNRLIERGFLSSEKQGKERMYYPVIDEKEYLKFETETFLERYHGNSVKSFVASMYDNEKLKQSDLEELLEWAKERGNEEC